MQHTFRVQGPWESSHRPGFQAPSPTFRTLTTQSCCSLCPFSFPVYPTCQICWTQPAHVDLCILSWGFSPPRTHFSASWVLSRSHPSFGSPTSKANQYISLSDLNSLGKINKQLGPETKDCWLLRETVQELQNLAKPSLGVGDGVGAWA